MGRASQLSIGRDACFIVRDHASQALGGAPPDPRRGPPHRHQHRQAAGAAAQALRTRAALSCRSTVRPKECYSALGICGGKIMSIQRLVVACAAAFAALMSAISDGVATLTFNRPDRLNALSTPIMEGLLEAPPRLARDAAVGVIVPAWWGRE
jgi:hypothetical protein